MSDFRLQVNTYKIDSDKVDAEIKIAQVSDLHSCWYGKNQQTLINAIDNSDPDIVVMTGDIYDDRLSHNNADIFLEQISKKYSCYYVTGNHEIWAGNDDEIKEKVRSYGVTVLEGTSKTLEINGQKINICGIDDLCASNYHKEINIFTELTELNKVSSEDTFSLLLSHRPELLTTYKNFNYDLVLTGHAHGGQWRVPGVINGLYAPNQGLLPKYAGGFYKDENTNMIVSRGLSRENNPVPRFFNRPELVIIEIE